VTAKILDSNGNVVEEQQVGIIDTDQTHEEFYGWDTGSNTLSASGDVPRSSDSATVSLHRAADGSLALCLVYTDTGGVQGDDVESTVSAPGSFIVKDDTEQYVGDEYDGNSANNRWAGKNTDGYVFGTFPRDDGPVSVTIGDWDSIGADKIRAVGSEGEVSSGLEKGSTVEFEFGGSPTSSVKASATTIAYVPGREDESRNIRSSGFPDSSPLSVPLVPDAFYGDAVEAKKEGVNGGLPMELQEALDIRKVIDEEGTDKSSGIPYRLKNTLNISYVLDEDGGIDQTEPIQVTVNVEGPVNENHPAEIDITAETLPETVLHDEDFEAYNTSLVSNALGEFEEQAKPPTTNDRYLNITVEEMKNELGESLEAVRASTIWGAVNSFTQELISNSPLNTGEGEQFLFR